MTIVEDGEQLRIEGAGSERACIAYASEKDGRLCDRSSWCLRFLMLQHSAARQDPPRGSQSKGGCPFVTSFEG